MKQQFDLYFEGIELSRKLSIQALGGFEKLVARNLDLTEAFVGRTSQLLKAASSGKSIGQEPAQWAEAFQNGLRDSIELTRDAVLAATDYQTEAMHLLQDQAAEMQKLISATFSEQLGAIKTTSGEKRVGKSALVQKIAA